MQTMLEATTRTAESHCVARVAEIERLRAKNAEQQVTLDEAKSLVREASHSPWLHSARSPERVGEQPGRWQGQRARRMVRR